MFGIGAVVVVSLAASATPPLAQPTDWAIPISRELRSASLANGAPDKPRQYRLLCAVYDGDGTPRRCIESSATLPADIDAFVRGNDNPVPTADPFAEIAAHRVLVARLNRQRSSDKKPGYVWWLIDETVSPADIIRQPPPVGEPLTSKDVRITNAYSAKAFASYPDIALRDDRQAKVILSCQIATPNRLICSNGQVITLDDPSSTELHNRAVRTQLLYAALQVSSMFTIEPKQGSAADIVGRQIEIPIIWSLPGI